MANSKKKGNRIELKIVNIFKERFGNGFQRVPSSGAITGGKNFARTQDLSEAALNTLSGDIITPDGFAFSVEVKGRKDFNFWDFWNKSSELNDWILQVTSDAERVNKFPLLIIHCNNKETFVLFKKGKFKSNFMYNEWNIMLLKELLEFKDNFFYEGKK